MKPETDAAAFRRHRNTRLYRSVARILREYNRRLVLALRSRGFEDFSPAFPRFLSNLDAEGTRVGVLATRAGASRQAAGKLLTEIERCGYVERRADPDDARATVVFFTPRGRRMLQNVISLIEEMDRGLAKAVGPSEFDRLESSLFRIAEHFDPGGALGHGDR